MLNVYDVMPKAFKDALSEPYVTDLAIRDNGHGYVESVRRKDDVGDCRSYVEAILCLAAHAAGVVINNEHPALECVLPNGERLTGKRPVVGGEWTVTIRCPMKRRLTWEEQIEFGTVTTALAGWIDAQIAKGHSGIVIGEMGSGKSTLLSTMLGSESLQDKNTVKVEAVPELIGPPICVTYLIGPHCTFAMAREKLLRESAKVVIIGEARNGAEMGEVMTTMGTGHQSFTTLHAKGIAQAPHRIEDMLRQNGDTRTREQIHENIVRNVDFCIYMEKLADGRRVVSDVAALTMQDGVAVRKEIMPTHAPKG